MTEPTGDRRNEHAVIKVTGPPQLSSGLARYFRQAMLRLNYLEYGDPREYLEKRIPDAPATPLSDVWVPPRFIKKFTRGEEVSLNTFLADPETCRLVLADPGFGKSTLARFLTCDFIVAYERGVSGRFGVYVPLSQLRTSGFSHHEAVALAAATYVGLQDDDIVRTALAQELRRATIIFDGLDELPTARRSGGDAAIPLRADAQELIAALRHRHPVGGGEEDGIPSIVTCRYTDYFEDPGSTLAAPHYVMSSFSPPQRDQAVYRWHEAALAAVLKVRPEDDAVAKELAERAAAILGTMREHADVGGLCLTPLMLSILQTVYAGKWDLPASVSQLCSRAIDWMLIDKQPGPDPNPLNPPYPRWLRDVVTELAWILQERFVADGARGFSTEELRSIVSQVATIPRQQRGVYEDAVTSVCTFLERGHGILVKLSAERFDFAHNMLREVMAGRALGRLTPSARRTYALDESWAGPIRYWAGLLAAENKGAFEISTMIDELERDVQEGSLTAAVARAEMLVEVCLVQQRGELPRRLQQLIEVVKAELVKTLGRRDLARTTRIRIGDLLSVLGDPTQLIAWPDTVEWILAGNRLIGATSNPRTKINKYDGCQPTPQITGHLPGFGIGRYLVTNRDYEAFINAGGYSTERHWCSPLAWQWAHGDTSAQAELTEKAGGVANVHFSSELASERLVLDEIPNRCTQMIVRSVPFYWMDPSFNRPNQPVVGVNWWEAAAYCRWLTERLRSEGGIRDDQVIRLPLEPEWETAARLCGDGVYPWVGGDPSECAHVRVTAGDDSVTPVMRSCAIGLFHSTPSRLPIYDLVGNVWEWTASEKQPYSAATFVSAAADDSMADRIARGSSWLSREPEAAKITFRSFDPPYNAYDDLGFRIVVAPIGT
jgi:formylglycine-generating enzyme required for sulfatase activity